MEVWCGRYYKLFHICLFLLSDMSDESDKSDSLTLLFSSSAADDSSYFRFTHAYIVEQWQVTWASELAATALNAVHDVVVLHLVPHAVPCLFAEEPWFETHWTSAYALTAAYAVGNLLAHTLCLWQE